MVKVDAGAFSPGAIRRGQTGLEQTGRQDAMAEPAAGNDLQQKYRQFLDLLPLTLSIAGLPASEHRLFSEEQMEARAMSIRTAFRVAKNTVRDCLGGS